MRTTLALGAFAALAAVVFVLALPPAGAASSSQWSAPSTFASSVGYRDYPVVQVSPSGDAVVVFLNSTGTAVVQAYNYTPAGGWSAPVNLTNLTDSVPEVTFGMDRMGQGIAAWVHQDLLLGGSEIRMARFLPGIGWQAPEVIPTVWGNASALVLRVGANGDAFLSWSDYNDSFIFTTYVARYTVAGGWDQVPHYLAADNATASDLLIGQAVGPNGQAAFTWSMLHNATVGQAFAAFYEPGTGWGSPAPMQSYDRAHFPGVVWANDTAVFSWAAYTGTKSSAYMQTYRKATGWSSITPLQSFPDNVTSSYIVGTSAGDLVAYFFVRPTATTRDLWLAHYTAAGGWEAAVPVEVGPGNSTALQIVADAWGNFVATFLHGSGQANELLGTRYLVGRGWQPVGVIAAQQPYLNFSYLAVSPAGNAFLVWIQTGTPYELEIASFSRDDEAPTITMTSPGALVRNRHVAFNGTTDPTASVWIDGTPAAVNGSGGFSLTVDYVEGSFTVEVLAEDYEGNQNRTTLSFVVDLHADLQVDYPLENDVVSNALIPVRGVAEAGGTVTVNGGAVTVDAFGIFDWQVVLTPGRNTIRVGIVDPAGNTAQIEVNVTYQDPIAPILAELANLSAKLDALQNSTGASQAELDALRAELATAKGELAAANASLANSTANFLSVQLRLSEASISLSIAEARLTDAQRERDAANARADAAAASGSGSGATSVLLAAAALGGVAVGALGLMMGRRRGRDSLNESNADSKPPQRP